MKATIAPVFESQIDPVCLAFFRSEYSRERLGHPGRWMTASPLHYAPSMLERERFEAVLKATAFRSPDAPVAWHVRFDPGQAPTTLWALADKPTRIKIETTHSLAADVVLSVVGCHLNDAGSRLQTSDAFCVASFMSGADALGAPSLHTDAFLMHLPFDGRAAQSKAFSNANILSLAPWVDQAYRKTFASNLTCEIGRFDKVACEMLERASVHVSQLTRQNGSCKTGESIFLAWQDEAAAHGFGREKVEAVLKSARENRTASEVSRLRAFLQKATTAATSVLNLREALHERHSKGRGRSH